MSWFFAWVDYKKREGGWKKEDDLVVSVLGNLDNGITEEDRKQEQARYGVPME